MSDESNQTPPAESPAPETVSPEVSFLRNLVTRASRLLRDPKTQLTGSARLVAELLDRHGGRLLGPAETYRQMAAWRDDFNALQKTIDSHLDIHAFEKFDAQQKNLHARVNDAAHVTNEILTREQWEEKFLKIRESAQEAQAALYEQNISTARALAERAAELLHDHAAELEASERDRFTRYGVTYNGSPLVFAVRAAEKFVLARVQAQRGTIGPDNVLPWLIL